MMTTLLADGNEANRAVLFPFDVAAAAIGMLNYFYRSMTAQPFRLPLVHPQGKANPLISSFHLTYYTLLNLLRRMESQNQGMEYVIARSFQQFQVGPPVACVNINTLIV
eukprot:scaffold518383_cov34-Prasinocladus_malaysianus.AAC.2